jgi:hypothetical protein
MSSRTERRAKAPYELAFVDRVMLVLEDSGGEPLQRLLLDPPMEVGRFLRQPLALIYPVGSGPPLPTQRGQQRRQLSGVHLPRLRRIGSAAFDRIGHGGSFRLDRQLLDDRPPFIGTGFRKRSECRRRLWLARKNLAPDIDEPRSHRRIG